MDGGITAGLSLAEGDAAVIMASDLQDPPELIPQFLAKWEEGYENVYQIVTRRRGTGLLRRVNSQLFYWIVNQLTGGLLPRNVSDFRLVDRKVLSVVGEMRERNRFMRGLFAWTGFKSMGIEHERPLRFAGDSQAHTLKVLSLAVKGILAYSYIPLRLITIMGILVSVFSFALLGYTVVKAVFWGVPFAGFGSIMTVLLLMFGLMFITLGVVGEYVGLIYEEVKGRPLFVIRETIGISDAAPLSREKLDARS
jgi:dolichol-phosphate mannosyltransferase